MSQSGESKREAAAAMAKAALNGGVSALSAVSAAASAGAKTGAKLAVGTLFAGANVMLDLGVRVARKLPVGFETLTPGGEGPVQLETAEGRIPVVVRVAGRLPAGRRPLGWWSPEESPVQTGEDAVAGALRCVTQNVYVVEVDGRIGAGRGGRAVLGADTVGSGPCYPLLAFVPAIAPSALGDSAFRATHGVKYAYAAGSMANGIASEAMVEVLSRAGLLGFFGAAGLPLGRIEAAIDRLQRSLGDAPFGFNLIHSPNEPELEAATVDLYLRRQIHLIEASAFLDLTLPLVRFRVRGIHRDANGQVVCPNRVVAKVSRVEVARKFFGPPPGNLVQALVESGQITVEQAALARQVPMADDVTAEADSGGHTDNRPAVALIPTMLALRDELQAEHRFARPVRVGAAGGVATPASAAAMFAMGAAYIMTGSINQACVEAGTSSSVREMLAQAGQADVVMAPAADMFEMGVKVQVLKWGTMFAVRARKLYDLYRAYGSLEEIPAAQRASLERDYFHGPLTEAWADTRRFWEARDPKQISRAEKDPKHKLALVFRSYLGQASQWAVDGEPSRKADYQVWCGPAMGAFNEWTKGSFLERPERRDVVTAAMNLLVGAAVVTRANMLRAQGLAASAEARSFRPVESTELRTLLQEEGPHRKIR